MRVRQDWADLTRVNTRGLKHRRLQLHTVRKPERDSCPGLLDRLFCGGPARLSDGGEINGLAPRCTVKGFTLMSSPPSSLMDTFVRCVQIGYLGRYAHVLNGGDAHSERRWGSGRKKGEREGGGGEREGWG